MKKGNINPELCCHPKLKKKKLSNTATHHICGVCGWNIVKRTGIDREDVTFEEYIQMRNDMQ